MKENNFNPEHFVDSNSSIICIKKTDGHVVYQNTECQKLCGDMTKTGEPCNKHCMLRYTRDPELPAHEEGTQYYPCQKIEDRYFDIMFVNDKTFLTSILYPLGSKFEAEISYYSGFHLTRREKEVVSLILRKKSNKEMAAQLNISLATLKTHLNNIYKKIPAAACQRLRETYNSNKPISE